MTPRDTTPPAPELTWSPPRYLPQQLNVYALSCPSAHLCVAALGTGLAVYVNPLAGGAWHKSTAVSAAAVACPSTQLCVASSPGGNVLVSRHPSRGPSSFRSVGSWVAGAVSCPLVTFCAASGDAQTFVSRAPSSRRWLGRPGLQPPASSLTFSAIACPSARACVIWDQRHGNGTVGLLPNPLASHSRVTRLKVDPCGGQSAATQPCGAVPHCLHGRCIVVYEEIYEGSCVAQAACLLTTNYGAILTSADVTAGHQSWTRTVLYRHFGRASGGPIADCVSTSLCYVGASPDGNNLTTTDLLASAAPFSGDVRTWSKVGVKLPRGGAITALSCPSTKLCFVLGTTAVGSRSFIIAGQRP
jgi:hypothetical protein